ncbi:hypothetical protein H1R20_g16120, partial [Candolleomyces eurysporus]
MEIHNIIFSGSAALSILEPDSLTPNNLDVYAPLGTMGLVHAFLSQHTSYIKFNNRHTGWQDANDSYAADGTADTGINKVAFYRHALTNSILNIIKTSHAIPTAAIFKFHSTFVMDYLTCNALVSAYPRMTADHAGLVNTTTPDLSYCMVRCLVKYGVRGFNALDRAYDWENRTHDRNSYGYC